MLKPLSLSLGLAVAFGACSLSLAGGHGKSLPTAQAYEVAPSGQAIPSAQSISEGCGDVCGPVKKKCDFFSKFKPKPCTYTYEWVLKKKKVHNFSLFGHKKAAGCGEAACDSCGTTPSGQSYSSPQAWGAGQTLGTTQIPASYSAPQGYSAPQAGLMPAPAAEAPPAPAGDAAPAAPAAPAPPAPVTPPTASTGGLQLLPAGN